MFTRMRAFTATAILATAGPATLLAPPADGARAPEPVVLDYTCTFPLVGPRPVVVAVTTNLPSEIGEGELTDPIDVSTVATVDEQAAQGLSTVGAATVEGEARASATLGQPTGADLPLVVPATIAQTPVPDTGGFEVTATASIPPISFTGSGTATVTVDDLLLTITPRHDDGRVTGLDTFHSDCTLDPGQDNVVATIEVGSEGDTEPPTTGGEQSFELSGIAHLRRSGMKVPFSGEVTTTTDADTGAFTADVDLDPTYLEGRTWGFLPVTAELHLEEVGETTGTITGDAMAAHVDVQVSMPKLTAFGFPIAGGENCRTRSPVPIDLEADSGWSNPMMSRTAAGAFDLPAFRDCGPLTGFVSRHVRGRGNTVQLTLDPRT